jgi:hypothetical protein
LRHKSHSIDRFGVTFHLLGRKNDRTKGEKEKNSEEKEKAGGGSDSLKALSFGFVVCDYVAATTPLNCLPSA